MPVGGRFRAVVVAGQGHTAVQQSPYRSHLKANILPLIGHLRLDEVKGSTVAAVLRSPRERGYAYETIDKHTTVMLGMFGYAVSEGHIEFNPVHAMPNKPFERVDENPGDQHEPVYLTLRQYRRILFSADPHDRPLIEFMAGSGTRFGEATAVQVGAFKTAGGTAVHVRRAWKRNDGRGYYIGLPKDRKKRWVTISPSTFEAVRPLLDGRAPDALVFTTPQGLPVRHVDWIVRIWNPAIVAAMRCEEPSSGATGPKSSVGGALRTHLRRQRRGHPGRWPMQKGQ
ncbi:hypothetical protein Val02_02660 [Virgisporangium aliadipatigenens]|uniref:Phage integrase central domain-containing protein n=1 Tax=Virgisporangium aliadipatigenens TaxID=741659 RepID=A0A8J3YG45_9ACTN|nr:hypothetical protein [Virgisporangium aliadipatigenens]GIJ43380.1 hypothetical protein Val02_02660 [Virgisporangium aliadipatigenens]